LAAAQAQFLKATSGALTVPVESLPTAAKPYVQTVYYLEQKTQAFSVPPRVVVQVLGATPYIRDGCALRPRESHSGRGRRGAPGSA